MPLRDLNLTLKIMERLQGSCAQSVGYPVRKAPSDVAKGWTPELSFLLSLILLYFLRLLIVGMPLIFLNSNCFLGFFPLVIKFCQQNGKILCIPF